MKLKWISHCAHIKDGATFMVELRLWYRIYRFKILAELIHTYRDYFCISLTIIIWVNSIFSIFNFLNYCIACWIRINGRPAVVPGPAWIFEVQQWASRQIQCQTQWPYTICDWYKSRQSRFINSFVMITFDANDVRSCDYATSLNVLWSISTKSWLNIQRLQKIIKISYISYFVHWHFLDKLYVRRAHILGTLKMSGWSPYVKF